ncbi:MAG: RnfABCDGE type electron transport complex subunit D [Xanthomonadales bacterium]|nr:RnfABCDGE type electron transport complex subunit D [Xanthomonadales bacterium]
MRQFPTAPAPHLPERNSVRKVMVTVMVMLLPGTLVQAGFFGPGVLVQIGLAAIIALALEAVCLRLRGQRLAPFLGDGSAVVTAWLFALCLPPLAPWWLALTGMVAAIVVGKHLYGGLGHNLFNPAMVGFAVVLVCFPLSMAQWPAAAGAGATIGSGTLSLLEVLTAIFSGQPPAPGWDGLSQATPLDLARQHLASGATIDELAARADYAQARTAWTWIAAAFAAGGIGLCLRRVADWRTPAAVIATTVVLGLLAAMIDADRHVPASSQLLTGGLVLAAFFIATDPVTGATTPRGRWLFGAGVAALTLAIRRWGAYPDGIAFAILLMNAAAPLIDRLTPPRIVGRRR